MSDCSLCRALLRSYLVKVSDVAATVQAATFHGCRCVMAHPSTRWRRVTAAAVVAVTTRAARESGTSRPVSPTGTFNKVPTVRRLPSDIRRRRPGQRLPATARWTLAHRCWLLASRDQAALNSILSVRKLYLCQFFVGRWAIHDMIS